MELVIELASNHGGDLSLAKRMIDAAGETVEVTRSGIFGGPADVWRRFAPGPRRYFLDGRVSSDEECKRACERYCEDTLLGVTL